MFASARGRKSIPGSINLSRVTFKDIGKPNTNAAEEADATSVTHRILDDDLSFFDASEYESETDETDDDDSDDEGKLTPRRELM
jgi:hypothetical protein